MGGVDGVPVEEVRELDVLTLNPLLEASVAEGFALVQRLVNDWASGSNRFDRPGEALLLARRGGAIVGVCGLNRDPYANDPHTGRLRHLYVAAAHRRQGIGCVLVEETVARAMKSFALLALRTDSPQAAAFYEALGFARTTELPSSTHRLDLTADRSGRGLPAGS
jgi:ribosomal protein S18 acetylase RimI-like enzyme